MARLLLILLLAIAASCSGPSFEVTSTRAEGMGVLPPIDPSSVRLLKEPPEGHYLLLGEVRVRLRARVPPAAALSDPDIQAAIRDEAAKMGANAVIELDFVSRPGAQRPGACCGPEPATIVEIRATAIKVIRAFEGFDWI